MEQRNSHNPNVSPLGTDMYGDAVFNIIFDYKDYALSFYTGTPAELRVFRRSDNEDITEIIHSYDCQFPHLSATAEGLRDVMSYLDNEV